MGFVQDFQAGSIVKELKKSLALRAVVLRDGKMADVDAAELVPGDIVKVDEVTILWRRLLPTVSNHSHRAL